MKKNVSGQKIGAQMVTAADGTAFTGTVTVYITGDAGTQAIGSVGSGVCTHEGNGYHTYAPSQGETNYDLAAFTFIGTGAIPTTIQLFTRPTTGLLAPTVADRTLDVTSTGEAGIDWGNVGNKTTTNALTGTTISTAQVVDSVTTKTGYSLLATTGLGNQTANITGTLSGSVGSVTGAVGSVTGNVGGNVVGSVGSVTGHTPQTGDSYARIGANGAGLTVLASAANLATVDGIVDTILLNQDIINEGVQKASLLIPHATDL